MPRGSAELQFPDGLAFDTEAWCNDLGLKALILSHLQLNTYDHRVWRTGLPVRSAVLKPIILHSQYSISP
ncbi:hypothetical protein ACN38_g12635 [Penicillium nordicum]|uniref:Uncharacterized protein n=1 Tax=Penicillium nordicum TaxID=229535 RepID=A0A0M8NXX2_9EURO|nr:hypothetical protein ACN38_g12635 [Penicillium nordicum]